MNILAINLLQASAGNAPASGGGMFWIMMILLFVVMWAFMIRPQRKQQKELEKFRNELRRGDKVVTAGGIYGVVDEIKEKSVLIKVDGDVKLRVDKNSIVRDFTEDAPKA
jgi:preprotein translocase subunit YajC